MTRVRKIRDDGSLIVEGSGLYFVVGGNEVIAELQERPIADAIAEGWHRSDPDDRYAEVLSYADVAAAHSISKLVAICISSLAWALV